jgi:hypothetical protein
MLIGSADSFAAKGGIPGPPGGGEETGTNNLSVPVWVFSGGGLTNVTCSPDAIWPDIVPPTGDPLTGYPIDPLAYYYVQGINTWQAPCATWDAATYPLAPVTAAWGDNLTGDAKLKVGSPIRVEIVLTEDSTSMQDGYTVVKLDPAALDRESAYGTLATDDGTGSFSATVDPFVPLVYDHQGRLTIVGNDGLVFDGPASAEINATGKVVYGYNLRVTSTGAYEITFTFPNVDIQSADAGECAGTTCTLFINVGTGGGGGGGKGRP